MVGETVKEAPVPTRVPPQLPEYQSQLGAEFKAPPFTCKVVDWPGVIVVKLADTLEGAVGTPIATTKLLGVPEHRALFAFTLIIPLTLPGVTVMDVEVELPVHPVGISQV